MGAENGERGVSLAKLIRVIDKVQFCQVICFLGGASKRIIPTNAKTLFSRAEAVADLPSCRHFLFLDSRT